MYPVLNSYILKAERLCKSRWHGYTVLEDLFLMFFTFSKLFFTSWAVEPGFL